MLDDRLMEGIFQLRARLISRCSRFQTAHQPQPPYSSAIHIRLPPIYVELRLQGQWDSNVLR
jgi:hypothetical protein